MEFSEPQRRNRVRGLTRGLGGIKNLNFSCAASRPRITEVREGPRFDGLDRWSNEDAAKQRIGTENPGFAGRNSEHHNTFSYWGSPLQNLALPILSKNSESAVRTGGGGSDFQTRRRLWPHISLTWPSILRVFRALLRPNPKFRHQAFPGFAGARQ
jgi:hypothetical protein